MATKSLTITEDAYGKLKTLKCGDESFSDVITRIADQRIGNVSRFLGILDMSDEQANEWKQEMVKRREEFDSDLIKRKKRFKL